MYIYNTFMIYIIYIKFQIMFILNIFKGLVMRQIQLAGRDKKRRLRLRQKEKGIVLIQRSHVSHGDV